MKTFNYYSCEKVNPFATNNPNDYLLISIKAENIIDADKHFSEMMGYDPKKKMILVTST